MATGTQDKTVSMNGATYSMCQGPIVGQCAPQFKAQAYFDGQIKESSLSDYKGKWVVLFFYPLDFTFVCPTEILEFSKHAEEFKKKNAQIIGASIDSVYSHKGWCEQGGLGKLNFPVISDITKKISRDYGILLEDKGISLRGTFVIDPEGKVRAATIHDLQVGRSVDETLRVLNAFQTGELCPVGWQPGQKTLGK